MASELRQLCRWLGRRGWFAQQRAGRHSGADDWIAGDHCLWRDDVVEETGRIGCRKSRCLERSRLERQQVGECAVGGGSLVCVAVSRLSVRRMAEVCRSVGERCQQLNVVRLGPGLEDRVGERRIGFLRCEGCDGNSSAVKAAWPDRKRVMARSPGWLRRRIVVVAMAKAAAPEPAPGFDCPRWSRQMVKSAASTMPLRLPSARRSTVEPKVLVQIS